jgi:hypothetical protein
LSKKDLVEEFIKLRAMKYSYAEICNELKISKPTAVKWGKLYTDEINKVRKNLLTHIYAERIVEDENGLMISINGLKSAAKNNSPYTKKITNKIAKRLEKIFVKELVAVQIIMKNKSEEIDRVIFIFMDNVIVKKQ